LNRLLPLVRFGFFFTLPPLFISICVCASAFFSLLRWCCVVRRSFSQWFARCSGLRGRLCAVAASGRLHVRFEPRLRQR
jgi:hypothetical protein